MEVPRFPSEDMGAEDWATPLRDLLSTRGPDDAVIGHSFDGSILLKVLADRDWPVGAAPCWPSQTWGPEGWAVEEYAAHEVAPTTALSLHHCRDDDIVEFAHLARHAVRLPAATVHEYASGGHQFDGRAGQIADSMRQAMAKTA